MTVDRVTRARGAIMAAVDDVDEHDQPAVPEVPELGGDAPAPTAAPATAAGDWRLTAGSLRFLTVLVDHLEPRLVLEFGSGRSTVVLGRSLASLRRPGTLVTIENDPDHLDRTRAGIVAAGLETAVHLRSAPVVVRRCHDRNVPVYLLGARACSTGRSRGLRRPDLILVDGPPLPLGGREGALYQALHSSHEGTVIVLDDSRRDSEREVLVRLLQRFDGHIEAVDLLGFPKGLALIVVTETIPTDDFPEELIHA